MTSVEQAWQQALAAEDQAYFGYPRLGPWLSATLQDQAHADGDAHALLRDKAASAMAGAGIDPVAPAADYPLPRVVTSAAAVALAVRLEEDCATAWRGLYAVVARAAERGAGSEGMPTGPAPAPTPTGTTTSSGTTTPTGTTTSSAAAVPGARDSTASRNTRTFVQQAWTASAVRAALWRRSSSPNSATDAFPGL